jgi:POT family proton-dependent oligopeptide transporter
MGINLGAFFSPLVCGSLGQLYGWHYGFSAAGFGMLAGLLVYHFGRHLLPQDKQAAQRARGEDPGMKGASFAALTILGFLSIAVLFFVILILPAAIKALIGASMITAVLFALRKLEAEDRSRVIALLLLCLGTIVFWAIYEQQGNTLQLWADEKTDWNFFGFEVPTTWYQSFNPAMIFAFAPLLDMIWNRRAKQGKASSSVRKMGIGSMLCGIAFIIMILAAKVVGDGDEKGSLLWLAITTWIFTMGELYLSPIGLSLVSKVAPAKMLSMMMGMWFLSSFFGNYLAGYIGTFYEKMPKDAFFLMLCVMGVAVGVFFFAAEKRLRRVIGDA